jgi:hypothetical protein
MGGPIRVQGWKESWLMRGLIALVYCGGVFSISKDIGGPADQQPWWGVVITLILGVLAPLFAWHTYRVLERSDD